MAIDAEEYHKRTGRKLEGLHWFRRGVILPCDLSNSLTNRRTQHNFAKVSLAFGIRNLRADKRECSFIQMQVEVAKILNSLWILRIFLSCAVRHLQDEIH